MASNNYGYTSASSYHVPNENMSHHSEIPAAQTGQNYYSDVQQNPHPTEGYPVHQTGIHANTVDYRSNKCNPANAYYEQSNQMHMHQGGEASNIPSNYVASPDPFPTPRITTTATAIAAATAAVIAPPGTTTQNEIIQEAYGNYAGYYNDPVHGSTQAPQAAAENSNSSSDFNFLSNLANDFAPEYYQLS